MHKFTGDLNRAEHEMSALRRERDRLKTDNDALRELHLKQRMRVEELEAANWRLREAISDAITDLRPGVSPYSILIDALDQEGQ